MVEFESSELTLVWKSLWVWGETNFPASNLNKTRDVTVLEFFFVLSKKKN